MPSILDRLKSLAVRVEAELPPGMQKLTVIVEQKAASAEAALKRAADAVSPAEIEGYVAAMEKSMEAHFAAIGRLIEAHGAEAVPSVDAAPAVPTSDAVPTAAVL